MDVNLYTSSPLSNLRFWRGHKPQRAGPPVMLTVLRMASEGGWVSTCIEAKIVRSVPILLVTPSLSTYSSAPQHQLRPNRKKYSWPEPKVKQAPNDHFTKFQF